MLRAQAILYARCADALRPFKYSGYPLLLKVIATTSTTDAADEGAKGGSRGGSSAGAEEDGGAEGGGAADASSTSGASSSASPSGLFSEANEPLLLPAATLLQRTLEVAPLNAHELQRVGGIEAVVSLFRRCVSMLTLTSDESALPYKVALPLLHAFSAVARCPEATARLEAEECAPALDDVVRCLHLTAARPQRSSPRGHRRAVCRARLPGAAVEGGRAVARPGDADHVRLHA